MSAFTVRLTDDVAAKLDLLAARLARSPADVAAEAIGDFVEREAWSLADIEAGLAEAKAGEFSSPAEVSEVLKRYTGTPDQR